MRKCIFAISLLLTVAFANAEDVQRITVSGYRLGDDVTVRALSNLKGLSVAPESGLVYSNALLVTSKSNVFKATVPFGYRLSHWTRTWDDPRFERSLGEKIPGSEDALTLTVPYDGKGDWIYLAPIIVIDDRRTVTIAKSPFGEGTVGTNLGVHASMKGDVFKLAAIPASDEKTGFDHSTFRRWEDGSANYLRNAVVDSNDTFRAEFVPNSWDVTFDANGGEVFPTSKVVTCDATYGWLPTPTRAGCTFKGWFTDRQSGNASTENSAVLPLGAHTLYARWDGHYTVVFDANGGTGLVMSVEQEFEVGVSQSLKLNAFYYPGRVFVGWNQSSVAEEKQFFDEQVVRDIAPAGRKLTLYAVWREEKTAYTVCFDKNSEDATGTMADQSFAGGEEKPLFACNFKREGWTFLGWSTDSNALEAAYQDREKVQNLTKEKELTLYAVWTQNPVYYVNYLKTSADQEPSFRETVECGKSYMLAASDRLKWPGYALDSWKNGESSYSAGKTLTAQDVKKLAGDGDTIIFLAKWDPIRYTIKLDGNGGTCKINNNPSDVVYGAEVEFTIADGGDWFVKRDGYDLLSYWSRDAVLTNEIYVTTGNVSKTCLVVSNLTTTADETVTLYAQWQGTNLTVTINGEPVVLRYGSELKQPEDPVKEGYLFGGWTTNGVAVTFPIVVTGSFDLKPKLTPIEYSVEFDGNGADGGSMASQSFTYDATKNLSSNGFLRTDYTFSNWTNATGDAYADGESVKNLAAEQGAVVHLYATWTKNGHYTVRFNGNGGTTTDSLATYDQDFTLDVAQALKSNDFVRTGHDFLNWTDEAGVCYADGATVINLAAESEVSNLYAVWQVHTHELVWIDGEEEDRKASVAYGTEVPDREPLSSRKGYVFTGWATNGTIVSLPMPMPDRDLTLEATWRPAQYKIAFNGNGADGGTAMDPIDALYNQDIELTSNRFVRAGYSFVGWATTSGGAKIADDGETVRNLTDKDDTTVMLYARWVEEKGNDLSIALGLPGNFITTVSAEGAWTIVGEPNSKQGLQRTDSSANGTLTISVSEAGFLVYSFNLGDNSSNRFSWTFKGEELKDNAGNTSYTSGKASKTLTFSEPGTLVFTGTPDDGETWKLYNFTWTPKK